MGWLQLSLALDGLDAGAVEDACLELGAVAVTLSDAGDTPVLEPLPGTTPVWPQTRLTALFEESAPPRPLRRHLAATLSVDAERIRETRLADREWDRDWAREYARDARAMCFGSRLWVCQSGTSPDDPEALRIDLDPGLAFGSGTHESTALCLEWLARTELRDKVVIDYGCGSGILALAAATLGARAVLATDIDPQALTATEENAERNGLTERISVCEAGQLAWSETDILTANILASPLRELAPLFARLVKPGGRLALAGILQEQVGRVLEAYAGDFEIAQTGRLGDWALLSGRRSSCC